VSSIGKYVGWVIGIATFVWATISAFSIFEQLKFLVDGWSWTLGHVSMPTNVREAFLLIGQWVHVKVANYRDFVRWVVATTIHLPHLPQVLYDAAGVVAFAVGRGLYLGRLMRRETQGSG
jgi:hypothetical protein